MPLLLGVVAPGAQHFFFARTACSTAYSVRVQSLYTQMLPSDSRARKQCSLAAWGCAELVCAKFVEKRAELKAQRMKVSETAAVRQNRPYRLTLELQN